MNQEQKKILKECMEYVLEGQEDKGELENNLKNYKDITKRCAEMIEISTGHHEENMMAMRMEVEITKSSSAKVLAKYIERIAGLESLNIPDPRIANDTCNGNNATGECSIRELVVEMITRGDKYVEIPIAFLHGRSYIKIGIPDALLQDRE